MSDSDANDQERETRPACPFCQTAIERINQVLDGDLSAQAIEMEQPGNHCQVCRARLTAGRQLASVLAAPVRARSIPAGMTDRILAAVLADRQMERRRLSRSRTSLLAAGIAVAALVLMGIGLDRSRAPHNQAGPAVSTARQTPEIPSPDQHSPAAMQPPPVHLGEQLSRAEQSLVNSSRPFTESAEAAPRVFTQLADVLSFSARPATEFEPARVSLLELPEAARTGLEPVTTSAQKAFARLIHDVGAVQPTSHQN